MDSHRFDYWLKLEMGKLSSTSRASNTGGND